MQIQINTDRNVEGVDALTDQVEADVASVLERFSSQITRVEVHLGDVNAGKGGANDMRCMIEVRPEGQQPVAVTNEAASLDEAVDGALKKIRSLLDTRLGRLNEHKGAASIRDNDLR